MRPRFLWIFLVCFLTAAAALIYPMYVIRPFRHQSANELMLALAVLRYRPAVMIACVVAALATLIWYWRSATKLRAAAASLGVLVIAALALLARINVYEIMFHPIPDAKFSGANTSKLDPDEKVIAIRIGSESRAYPIRITSYHHIINDVVGGIPIASTY